MGRKLDVSLTRRMTGLVILERNMKSIWMGSLALLVASPVIAGPGKGLDGRTASDEPATVMPISIDGNEPRAGLRLRDTLRQPFDDMDDGGKPYRLSEQERQRLREQLRWQPSPTRGLKP